MNVQIGDTVILFDWVGGIYAAIVTGFHSENTISCTYFPPLGGIKIFNGLMHKSEAKPLAPYWDFRPSQKVTPPIVKAEPNNPAQFTISTEGQPYLYWDINLQKVEIKPRQYFEDKPALGTFEWALVALKNGHKVRRLKWSDKTLAVKCEYNFLRFTDDDVFPDDSNDLLETDWVLA